MSDRAATNTKIENELKQLKGGDINNFKCAMHPLDSFARVCEGVMTDCEKTLATSSNNVNPQL